MFSQVDPNEWFWESDQKTWVAFILQEFRPRMNSGKYCSPLASIECVPTQGESTQPKSTKRGSANEISPLMPVIRLQLRRIRYSCNS